MFYIWHIFQIHILLEFYLFNSFFVTDFFTTAAVLTAGSDFDTTFFSASCSFFDLFLYEIRGVRNASELVHAITENRDVKLSELDVKELVLVRSTLTPKGPVYETADSFELKGT